MKIALLVLLFALGGNLQSVIAAEGSPTPIPDLDADVIIVRSRVLFISDGNAIDLVLRDSHGAEIWITYEVFIDPKTKHANQFALAAQVCTGLTAGQTLILHPSDAVTDGLAVRPRR